MEAMIFAAGVGSRLKPFTDSHPKALAPVNGIPALQHVIIKLKDAGIKRMVVNVHHFGGQVVDFLRCHENFGCDIVISDECGMLLDTGGGLLKAKSMFSGSEPILLHNADILTDFPIAQMCRQHEAMKSDVTLMVSDRGSSRKLYFSNENVLRGWQNMKTGECKPTGLQVETLVPKAFGGVHIVSPTIFESLEKYRDIYGDAFSIMPYYLANIDNLNIIGYVPDGEFRWHDIGTSEKLQAANRDFSLMCYDRSNLFGG